MRIPENHQEVRETFTWGTYGIDGKDPKRNILVKDIEDQHLLNILKHLEDREATLADSYTVMLAELHWRMRDCFQ